MGQIGMLTFKDSVALLASQLCRNRQQVMSFAKVESWMDADCDPVIDTKNRNPETPLVSYKVTHGKTNARAESGPFLLCKMVHSYLFPCFHATGRNIPFRLSSLNFIT